MDARHSEDVVVRVVGDHGNLPVVCVLREPRRVFQFFNHFRWIRVVVEPNSLACVFDIVQETNVKIRGLNEKFVTLAEAARVIADVNRVQQIWILTWTYLGHLLRQFDRPKFTIEVQVLCSLCVRQIH